MHSFYTDARRQLFKIVEAADHSFDGVSPIEPSVEYRVMENSEVDPLLKYPFFDKIRFDLEYNFPLAPGRRPAAEAAPEAAAAPR